MDGAVGFQEVGLEVDLKPISGETLDRVVNGEDVNPLAVLDIGTGRHGDNVAETNSEVVADNSVHPDSLIGDGIVREHDANGLFAFLSFQQNCVATEKLKLVHFGLGQRHHRVVVIGGLLDNQTVGLLFLLEDGRGQLLRPEIDIDG